ncbi:MAG: DUF1178 family protein [Acetobacteraceae bacterium]
MIHYQVRCSSGHEFDGWFKDSSTFDRQVKHGQVECPLCGDRDVARALMAPALPRAAAPPAPPAPARVPAPDAAKEAGKVVSDQNMPDQMRAVLQRMRAEIESKCDYVGPSFADEARRIHRGESERRGIYGEASAEDAEALSEDGISVSRIPWVDRAES